MLLEETLIEIGVAVGVSDSALLTAQKYDIFHPVVSPSTTRASVVLQIHGCCLSYTYTEESG